MKVISGGDGSVMKKTKLLDEICENHDIITYRGIRVCQNCDIVLGPAFNIFSQDKECL
ncbi:MAG: hypothetical protein ACFFDN_20395 [Candidatus Hodarchaeota archaeon]